MSLLDINCRRKRASRRKASCWRHRLDQMIDGFRSLCAPAVHTKSPEAAGQDDKHRRGEAARDADIGAGDA